MTSPVKGNPRDPIACDYHPPTAGKQQLLKKLKKQIRGTLLHFRYRANARNISLLLIGLMFLTILVKMPVKILVKRLVHRLEIHHKAHLKWLHAPITYLQRTCPKPAYATMNSKSNLETATPPDPSICFTTLTDTQSDSWYQRLMRVRDFDDILELTWENKLKYTLKHKNYHLWDGSPLIDASRPPAWSKIHAIRYLLDRSLFQLPPHQQPNYHCDWVVWADADTVIMNSQRSVEDFLPLDSSIDLIVGTDKRYGWNAGVFVFRNSAWSQQFLEKWWNMKSHVKASGDTLSGDNHAMSDLLESLPKEEFSKKVAIPARCTLNSFAKFFSFSDLKAVTQTLEQQDWYMSEDWYHKGDFIAHTPGYDNKAACIRLLLQEAV